MSVSWAFPVDKLTAAYMGAHANQYAMNMTEWFPESNWTDSFRYAMERGYETVRRQVLGFPEVMTLKEITDRAPAYWE